MGYLDVPMYPVVRKRAEVSSDVHRFWPLMFTKRTYLYAVRRPCPKLEINAPSHRSARMLAKDSPVFKTDIDSNNYVVYQQCTHRGRRSADLWIGPLRPRAGTVRSLALPLCCCRVPQRTLFPPNFLL